MPELHGDLVSAPTRACALFCEVNKLPVEFKQMSLGAGDHRSPQYLSINPLGKVPCLTDGTYKLPESGAIMCYLATKYKCPANWCPPPSDLEQRGRFDAAMNWWHTTIRAPCYDLLMAGVLAGVFGLQPNPLIAAHGAKGMRKGLEVLESYWLSSSDFMTGSAVSAPDLLVACQIEMLQLLVTIPSGPQMLQLLENLPRVAAWRARVAEACGPDLWLEKHGPLVQLVKKLAPPAST